MGPLEGRRTYSPGAKVSDYCAEAFAGRSCRPVSAEEYRRICLARMSEPPVFLESSLNLSIEELIAVEEVEAAAEKRPILEAETVECLWFGRFAELCPIL